jgi:O-antigen/teichoic acid export membrane protein
MNTRSPARALTLHQLTSGHALARNIVWNFIGLAAPLPIAVVTIPQLTSQLGTARFGGLALIWALIGYSSILDLGLGRVLTKVVAQKLTEDQDQDVGHLIWTALSLLAALGLVGTVLIGVGASWFVDDLLRIPLPLQPETRHALMLIAIILPFVTTATGLRGLLEAQHRFGFISGVSLWLGCVTLIGPVLVLPYSHSLVAIVAVMLVGRLLAWIAYLFLCLRTTPGMMHMFSLEPVLLGPLLRFGGWLTVSNIISPILTYFDRFVVGFLLSVSAVAYYTVPYDMVIRVGVISGALSSVLFPAFAASYMQDRDRTNKILGWGVRTLIVVLAPVLLCIAMFAREGLQVWLGADYAENSAAVLQWLAVGLFINSMAHIPFALIQAAGRPDLTAKLHASELIPYLVGLWWLVGVYGIKGAAIAWTTRVTVDTLVLLWMTHQLLPQSERLIRQVTLVAVVALLVGAISAFSPDFALRVSLFLAALIAFPLAAWYLVLTPADRALVRRFSASVLRGSRVPSA